MRLSIINFAGIARTLVAVGTESDASIDATTRPATPRIGSIVDALGVTKTGAGLTCACAGVGVEGVTCADGVETAGVATTGTGVTCVTGTGVTCVTGSGVTCVTGTAETGAEETGAACVTGAAEEGATCAAGAGAEIFCAALGIGGVPPFGVDAAAAGADATGAEDAAPGE